MDDNDGKYGILDYRDLLMTKEDLERMRAKGEGYKEILMRWYRMRLSMGMAQVFEHLDIVPPSKVQNECLFVLMQALVFVPDDTVLEWSKGQADWMNRQEDGGGHA